MSTLYDGGNDIYNGGGAGGGGSVNTWEDITNKFTINDSDITTFYFKALFNEYLEKCIIDISYKFNTTFPNAAGGIVDLLYIPYGYNVLDKIIISGESYNAASPTRHIVDKDAQSFLICYEDDVDHTFPNCNQIELGYTPGNTLGVQFDINGYNGLYGGKFHADFRMKKV